MSYTIDDLLLEGAVRSILTRYLFAIDDRDFASVARCFTPDARFWFDGQAAPTVGVQAITEYTRTKMSPLPFSEHALTNLLITRDGKDVIARTYVTVRFVVESSASPAGAGLITRGIRYTDRLRPVNGDYLIKDRIHKAAWITSGFEELGLTDGQTSRGRNDPPLFEA